MDMRDQSNIEQEAGIRASFGHWACASSGRTTREAVNLLQHIYLQGLIWSKLRHFFPTIGGLETPEARADRGRGDKGSYLRLSDLCITQL